MVTARVKTKRLGEHRKAGVATYHETKVQTDLLKSRPTFYKAWKKYGLDQYILLDVKHNTGVVIGLGLKEEPVEINLLNQKGPLYGLFQLKEKWSVARALQKVPHRSSLSAGDVTEKNLTLIENAPWTQEVKRVYMPTWTPYDYQKFHLNDVQLCAKGADLSFILDSKNNLADPIGFMRDSVLHYNGVFAGGLIPLIKFQDRLYKERGDKYIEYFFTAYYFDAPSEVKRAPLFRMHGCIDPTKKILFSARVKSIDEIYEYWDGVSNVLLTKWGVDQYAPDDNHYCYLKTTRF